MTDVAIVQWIERKKGILGLFLSTDDVAYRCTLRNAVTAAGGCVVTYPVGNLDSSEDGFVALLDGTITITIGGRCVVAYIAMTAAEAKGLDRAAVYVTDGPEFKTDDRSERNMTAVIVPLQSLEKDEA
jgi:hypothetical protein